MAKFLHWFDPGAFSSTHVQLTLSVIPDQVATASPVTPLLLNQPTGHGQWSRRSANWPLCHFPLTTANSMKACLVWSVNLDTPVSLHNTSMKVMQSGLRMDRLSSDYASQLVLSLIIPSNEQLR